MTAMVAVTTALAGEDALRDWQDGRSTLAEEKLAAAMAAWDGPETFAELARAWSTLGRERMLLKLVDEGLLRTAHLLDDDPVRRAILRAAAENMSARPERELELWRKLAASYWRPGGLEARAAREALAAALERHDKVDEAAALRRAIYSDHRDVRAASLLVDALLQMPSAYEEAESIAREWFVRSEPGPERALLALQLSEVLYRQDRADEANALRAQYPPVRGGCGLSGLVSGVVPGGLRPSRMAETLRDGMAGSERAAFDVLFRAAGFIGSLDAPLAQSLARDLADDLAGAFSRAYLSVHPSWAIEVAVLLADQLATLGLPVAATEIARRAEALLIEHQGEDSPLLEDARARLTPFRPNAAAAPTPTP